MYVDIDRKTGIVKFSSDLAKTAGLKPNGNVFIFKIKGENRFGLMPISRNDAKMIPSSKIRRSVKGFIYTTPKEPPAMFISASLRKNGRVPVKKFENDQVHFFIFG